MSETKRMKWLGIIGQLCLVALAVVTGNGMIAAAEVALTTEPEAQLTNPTNTTDATPGGKMVFPEQSVTTGQDADPDRVVYETQYDELLTKIRPVRTPIDQIMRRKARSKKIKSMEFKYATLGYQPISTTMSSAFTAPTSVTQDYAPATISALAAPGIFNRRDVIIAKGVDGYKEDGTTTSGEDLKLWVVNRNGNASITVIAINGPKLGNYKSSVPAIPADTVLVRIAKAAAELDSQAPGYAIFPWQDEQYCQKFMAQAEQSTIDALTAKRFNITLNDQEEATLADMRLGMEGAWLFGTKSKFLDPETQRYVWTTGGIWNMVPAEYLYQNTNASGDNYVDDRFSINAIIDLQKSVFTGPGAGRSDSRLVVCGSGLLATVEKAFVGNYDYKHPISKWDLTFNEVASNFGKFWFILDEVFDLHHMPNCGMIIDPGYLEKFTFEPFSVNTIDLNEQGVRDSKAKVLREISAAVLKSPMNHMKIVCDGETV